MTEAWVDGRSVALDVAVAEAAKLLRASRVPVIAGLGTDVAGARAAIALAERLGGVVDHMHSDALLRDLDVVREAGVMMTTPSEARLRGDVILLVGAGLAEAWPDLASRLLTAPLASGVARRILRLCPGREAKTLATDAATLGRSAEELAGLLALLRARIAGRPVGRTVKGLDKFVTDLKAARFGVAVWSAAHLDPLTIEMLSGVVKDLNAETRFTGLPLALPDNATGVLQACGWMTGFPMRTGFARGYPEHDPWRFDTQRLVESREADCVLWLSAYGASAPRWIGALPTIALTAEGEDLPGSRIRITVGQPGVSHSAVEHNAAFGTLTYRPASRRSDAPPAAEVIGRIAAALPGAWPC
jgi:formylmethanofuran dehydrogenase subunit B